MADEVAVDDNGAPILDQFSADGFVDCVFRITEVVTSAKSYSLHLVASHRGTSIGFRAIVRRGIRGGIGADMKVIRDHVYRPAVEFVRTGPESDALLAALRELYGMHGSAARMAEITPFTGIALHQEDVDMENQPIKIKLFGRDSDQEIARGEYFESFFNLDLRAGLAFWNEKDLDYRAPLIQGIST